MAGGTTKAFSENVPEVEFARWATRIRVGGVRRGLEGRAGEAVLIGAGAGDRDVLGPLALEDVDGGVEVAVRLDLHADLARGRGAE